MPELSGIIQNYLEGSIKTIGSAPVIEPKTITENGTYTAPEGVDGYSPITVNVPSTQPVIQEKVFSGNGTFNPPEGVDGYAPVIIDVKPTLERITITENGTYTPQEGVDGFERVTVNVDAPEAIKLSNNFNQSNAGSMGISYEIDNIDITWNGGDQIVCTISGTHNIASYNKIKFSFTTGTSYYNTIGAHVVRELYLGLTASPTAVSTLPNAVNWLVSQHMHDDNTNYTYEWDLTEIDSDTIYIYMTLNGWNVNNLVIELS